MKKIIITLSIIIVLILIYGFLINPHQLTIKYYQLETSKITDSFNDFKIAHFSDVFLGNNRTLKDLENFVNKINEQEPQIIVFTGDLISKNYKPSTDEVTNIKNILRKLDCTLYKYAVIGDNDEANLNLYKEILTEADFTILDNKSEYLFFKDINPLKIVGLTNINDNAQLLSDEDGINPSFIIYLTHYPDYALKINDADLILAGHSLGGQINIPFYGGLIKKTKAKTYLNNYYEINDTKLYISNGLGCENINFRLFNTPSISIYTLKKTI